MPVLLIAGIMVSVVGLTLFFVWFGAILAIIKAIIPLGLMAGGAVAAYLGWEELRDRRSPTMDFSSPDEANRYKSEAKAYQAELNEMKDVEKPVEVIEATIEKTDSEETK
ncbi:hypothetical protein C4J81_10580 [Deltaproteobacteria bacterium Smac51]|nr:hypothetical protein C4J81_10580 [Deltaproteobacteria bacterium Smac51]